MIPVIREDSASRSRWDLVALVLVVFSCLLVTYQFAFQHRIDLIGSLIIYLIDVFFLIDIILSFRTSYRHQGIDVNEANLIARHYRRGRFSVDLIGSLPFDLVLLPWSDFTIQGISIVLYLRLLRLFRAPRLIAVVRTWERQTSINVVGALREDLGTCPQRSRPVIYDLK